MQRRYFWNRLCLVFILLYIIVNTGFVSSGSRALNIVKHMKYVGITCMGFRLFYFVYVFFYCLSVCLSVYLLQCAMDFTYGFL